MPTRWQTFPVNVKGGYIDIIPSIQQGIDYTGSAILLENFEPSLKGGYRRINGYSKFDSNVVPSTDSTTQLLGVGFLDGTVVVPREGKIYSSTGSGWTEIATGRTQTTKQRFHTFNFNGTRKIIGVDGSNYPWTWDKTTFANLTGSTDIEGASHVVEFKDHLFFAKGDLVTFCAPFDETDFNAGNGAGSFRVNNDVTGMIVFRERLFVFSQDSISVLDGDSSTDFRLTSVSESVGCIKEDTIQEVAGDVMFLAADGLRLLGATDRIQDFANESASKNIQELITAFEAKYSQFSSLVVRGKSQYRIFGFSTLDSSVTEGWLGTQYQSSNPASIEWAKVRGIKVYGATSEVYNGEEFIYFVGDTEYVYRMESGTNFDGTAIQATYRTPFFSMSDPTIRKTIYSVKTYIEAEDSVTGQLQLSFDQASSSTIQPSAIDFGIEGGVKWGEFNWGDASWASGSVEGSIRTNTVGSGFSVSLEYFFSEDQKPFIIDTIYIDFATEDKK